ncbi:hypothetical protein PRIPAC_74683 [Pristionchus pacificus]|uniref:Uncharacterized protein n=1 Tax=Pristionchus pacificus TaxID=54126 RepID=A0A2A6CSI9_PRIPA|nr:hypothetical protein PRIPAC_74683 [Pristionchus pacificus]|eukprot:PDM81011.1 hypothetical protein PRIPAC_36014 [Pristionchus pacificus]
MDDAWEVVSDFLAEKFGCSSCPLRFSSTHDFDSHKCSPKIRCNGYIHNKACAAAPFNTMEEFLKHFKLKHIRKTACIICCMNFDEEKLRTHPIAEHVEEVPRSVKRFMTVPEERRPSAPKQQPVAKPPPCSTAAIPSTSSDVPPKLLGPFSTPAQTIAEQVPSTSTMVRSSPVPADPSPPAVQQSVKPAAPIFRPFADEEVPSTPSAAAPPPLAATACSATPAAAVHQSPLQVKPAATTIRPSPAEAIPSSSSNAASVQPSAAVKADVSRSTATPPPRRPAILKRLRTPAAAPNPPLSPTVAVARFAMSAAPAAPPAAADAAAENAQADAKILKIVNKVVRRMVDSIVRREDDMRRDAEIRAEGLKRKAERVRIDGATGAFHWTNSSDEAMEVSTSSVNLTPPNTISPVPVASSIQQPKQSESPHSGASLPIEETQSTTAHPISQPQTPFTISPLALDFFANRPQGVVPTLPSSIPPPPINPATQDKAIKEEPLDSSSSSSGPPALSPHPPQETVSSKQPERRIQEVVDITRAPTPPVAPMHEMKREPVEEHQECSIVQQLPASMTVFNKSLLEQGQAARRVPPPLSHHSIQMNAQQNECLNRMPAQSRNQARGQSTQPRTPVPPKPTAPLREVKDEPIDADAPSAPVVPTARKQMTGAPATSAAAAEPMYHTHIEHAAKDHQFCRPDEVAAPSTRDEPASVEVPMDMDHPYSKHGEASASSTSVQPTPSQGPIGMDHQYSKPNLTYTPSASAQPLTIQVRAEDPIADDVEVHVREGSFDSVPITPVDRLRLAPIPPYKSPHEVKEEPAEIDPEADAADEAPRVIERADFASFFSGFKDLSRGVQERIAAAEARAHELRRMAMDDLFDSGIDDGAATGSVDQPPSEVVHEELEPAAHIEDTDDPMDDGPSNSGMNNGTSAADEDPNLEPEAMEDEPVIDPTENLSRPSISRSVTPLRITRRSLRKHIGCDDPMEDGPSTTHVVITTFGREYFSYILIPLHHSTPDHKKKSEKADDSQNGKAKSLVAEAVTPRSCLKRRSSSRKSKAHIVFADKESVPANEAREGYNGQHPEEPAKASSENGSSDKLEKA